jgi:2-aminoadipate transaminase
MSPEFSNRIKRVPRSFIREILKIAENPDVISFAGGLPNPELFPVDRFEDAASKVLARRGSESLQYSSSEGLYTLREWICERYRKRYGLELSPDNVLITTGSQQGLDLAGKVLVEEGDTVVMERPGYLGAIQAFSLYTASIKQVQLEGEGPDLEALERALESGRSSLYYAIPNFQNPSGISYSLEKRKAVARLCDRYGVVLLEDDPYGELRFEGTHLSPIGLLGGGQGIMLGTLSKVAAPGLRIGWMVATEEIMERLLIAKQAADLHTSTFTQHLAWQYLSDNDLDRHIGAIRDVYRSQAQCMVRMLGIHFPEEAKFTTPTGGMFLWVTLPEGCSSMELFDRAIEKGVAFVPGEPFYVDGGGTNTMRLNFSNADEKVIEEGIRRLGKCLKEYLEELRTKS